MADEPEAVPAPAESEEEEVTPGYKAPEVKSLDEIQNLDADDDSLVKYKQTLLGNSGSVLDEGGPNVILKAFVFAPVDHPDVEMDLTGDIAQWKSKPLIVKEGAQYRVVIRFRVQREIVAGLRYFQTIHRKGIRVDKSNLMVGSYGPKSQVQEFRTPIEDAPSGMISRGHYVIKSKFTDDDKNIYLEWEWAIDIKKDWA